MPKILKQNLKKVNQRVADIKKPYYIAVLYFNNKLHETVTSGLQDLCSRRNKNLKIFQHNFSITLHGDGTSCSRSLPLNSL